MTAILRVMGQSDGKHFVNYHRVLQRAVWSGRAVSGRLLLLLVQTFVPTSPILIGGDDTIERRWGPKIAARGIYRDAVRSSQSHFVKASGLRWVTLMVLVPIPFAQRVWALPFLTILVPSERYYVEKARAHKKVTDWMRQALLCTNPQATPQQIVTWFAQHWQLEVTLREVREHLGVETRRQWSALAIARTTPVLLGLFSFVTLLAHRLAQQGKALTRRTAWYAKPCSTFSDALATVRYELWRCPTFHTSQVNRDIAKLPATELKRFASALCYST